MVKKPNRNIRSKRAEFDSEEDEKKAPSAAETQLEQPKSATNVAWQTAHNLCSKSTIGSKVLTYDEENDQEDEFKVKKSKQSRRIAKEMKKIKQLPTPIETATSTRKQFIKLEENDHDVMFTKWIRFKPLQPMSKANVTQTSLSATIIHAARKKREMARLGDYMSLKNSYNYKTDKIRRISEYDDLSDLENDAKGELKHHDAKHISMNLGDKMRMERQSIRHNFLAYEHASYQEQKSNMDNNQSDDEGDDDDEDRWEKEQLRKVFATQVDLKSMKKEKILKTCVNFEDSNSYHQKGQTFDVNKLKNLQLVTFDSIKSIIKKHTSSLHQTYEADVNQNNMTLERLNAAKIDLENIQLSKPITDEQYLYFQMINSYTRDFIDCFNEKIDEIETAETKWFSLFKQRTDRLIARKQADIRDQNVECSNALSTSGVTRPMDQAHYRRFLEREMRRRELALKREEKLNKLSSSSLSETQIELHEGFSSDEENSAAEENIFKQKRNDIVNKLTGNLFTDVIEDFYDCNLIMQRFDKWKKLCPSSYKNAYVALSFPKILSPLVRYDLIDWNPLEIDDLNYLENRKWFACLIAFNRNNIQVDLSVKYLDDLLLIPYIVEKTIVTRLVSIAECIYDPFSSRQTSSFAGIVSKLINDCPTLNSQSSNTKKLIETVYRRFKRAINEDVFIPLYSKQIIEQKTSEPSKFFHRQFWSNSYDDVSL